jgi:hypothetical protein
VSGNGNAEDHFMIPPDGNGEHEDGGGAYQYEQGQQIVEII